MPSSPNTTGKNTKAPVFVVDEEEEEEIMPAKVKSAGGESIISSSISNSDNDDDAADAIDVDDARSDTSSIVDADEAERAQQELDRLDADRMFDEVEIEQEMRERKQLAFKFRKGCMSAVAQAFAGDSAVAAHMAERQRVHTKEERQIFGKRKLKARAARPKQLIDPTDDRFIDRYQYGDHDKDFDREDVKRLLEEEREQEELERQEKLRMRRELRQRTDGELTLQDLEEMRNEEDEEEFVPDENEDDEDDEDDDEDGEYNDEEEEEDSDGDEEEKTPKKQLSHEQLRKLYLKGKDTSQWDRLDEMPDDPEVAAELASRDAAEEMLETFGTKVAKKLGKKGVASSSTTDYEYTGFKIKQGQIAYTVGKDPIKVGEPFWRFMFVDDISRVPNGKIPRRFDEDTVGLATSRDVLMLDFGKRGYNDVKRLVTEIYQKHMGEAVAGKHFVKLFFDTFHGDRPDFVGFRYYDAELKDHLYVSDLEYFEVVDAASDTFRQSINRKTSSQAAATKSSKPSSSGATQVLVNSKTKKPSSAPAVVTTTTTTDKKRPREEKPAAATVITVVLDEDEDTVVAAPPAKKSKKQQTVALLADEE